MTIVLKLIFAICCNLFVLQGLVLNANDEQFPSNSFNFEDNSIQFASQFRRVPRFMLETPILSINSLGRSNCETISSKVELFRDEFDFETGNLIRRCNGRASLNQCDGSCISYAHPSAQYGFIRVSRYINIVDTIFNTLGAVYRLSNTSKNSILTFNIYTLKNKNQMFCLYRLNLKL